MTQTRLDDDGLSLDRIGIYAILLGLVVFYLLPLEAGIVTSFKTMRAYGQTAPFLPALGGFTVAQWSSAVDQLSAGLFNSVLMAVPATVFSALLGSMTAYGLTNIDWRGQVGVYVLFVAGIFVPYQAVLVPLKRFWSQWAPLHIWLEPIWNLTGLGTDYAGLLALTITHIAYGIPICTLLFRSYYKSVSDEMVEAARLDGASIRRIYRRIILPLSVPMFAVTLIYQFTQIWNDLLFALIIVGPGDASVITQSLIGIGQSEAVTNFPLQMAAAFVTALPTLLVYIFFGEQFAKGVTA
ncbi:carbohydrate ABC transporter permease [Haloarchaeobius sp. FL176]|uniref:carbohydrate ABC transporter permease n=1 Tax=Haloarchaeobius sp. FL176 TaxID=2967129 RepID=UPI0021472A32|nr:carbohydrate ABC transporter permease [Haloarchaeobius sp. FL176]